MAKRKGGMGILPFVAVFLGLLAAGGGGGAFYFYDKFDQQQREEIPKLQEQIKKQEGLNRKAVDRWNELAPWVLDEKIQKADDFDGLDGPKAVDEKVVKVITTRLGRPEWTEDPEKRKQFALNAKLRIIDVITKQDEEIVSLTKQRDDQKRDRERLDGELKASMANKAKLEAEFASRNTDLSRQLAEKTQELVEANRLREARVEELNQKLKAEQAVAVKTSKDKDKEIADRMNENQRLEDKIRSLTQVKDPKAAVLEPDGEITGTALPLGLAYINLGRHQRIQRGMQFTVFTMGHGGLPREKGKVEVRSVETDSSKVGILSQVSEKDPIVSGDLIANPIYRMDDKPVFVLCGEMEQYSREDLVRLIEENGGRVATKVSPDTHFLVTGGERVKYEGDPNFREALQLGLRMMSEKDLLRYLPFYGENR